MSLRWALLVAFVCAAAGASSVPLWANDGGNSQRTGQSALTFSLDLDNATRPVASSGGEFIIPTSTSVYQTVGHAVCTGLAVTKDKIVIISTSQELAHGCSDIFHPSPDNITCYQLTAYAIDIGAKRGGSIVWSTSLSVQPVFDLEDGSPGPQPMCQVAAVSETINRVVLTCPTGNYKLDLADGSLLVGFPWLRMLVMDLGSPVFLGPKSGVIDGDVVVMTGNSNDLQHVGWYGAAPSIEEFQYMTGLESSLFSPGVAYDSVREAVFIGADVVDALALGVAPGLTRDMWDASCPNYDFDVTFHEASAEVLRVPPLAVAQEGAGDDAVYGTLCIAAWEEGGVGVVSAWSAALVDGALQYEVAVYAFDSHAATMNSTAYTDTAVLWSSVVWTGASTLFAGRCPALAQDGADSAILFVPVAGGVRALDARTGSQLWQFEAAEGTAMDTPFSPVVLADRTTLLVTSAQAVELVWFSRTEHSLLWRSDLHMVEGMATAVPVGKDQYVVAGRNVSSGEYCITLFAPPAEDDNSHLWIIVVCAVLLAVLVAVAAFAAVRFCSNGTRDYQIIE